MWFLTLRNRHWLFENTHAYTRTNTTQTQVHTGHPQGHNILLFFFFFFFPPTCWVVLSCQLNKVIGWIPVWLWTWTPFPLKGLTCMHQPNQFEGLGLKGVHWDPAIVCYVLPKRRRSFLVPYSGFGCLIMRLSPIGQWEEDTSACGCLPGRCWDHRAADSFRYATVWSHDASPLPQLCCWVVQGLPGADRIYRGNSLYN